MDQHTCDETGLLGRGKGLVSTLVGLVLATCTGSRSDIDDARTHTPSDVRSDEANTSEQDAPSDRVPPGGSSDAGRDTRKVDTITEPAPGSEANPDASTEELPYGNLPRFHLELRGEWIADRELSPEGLVVSGDPLMIADSSGLLRFARDGSFLSRVDRTPYSGVDAGYLRRQDGVSLFQMVGVALNFAFWSGDEFWEEFSDIFPPPRILSGVTLERFNGSSTRHYYVTDRDASSVILVDISTEKAELRLPGVAPEGINHSEEHGLLVADARGRRLLRVAEDLSEALATAEIPEPYDQSTPTGLSFFEGQLYVCFRGENRIAIFTIEGHE